MGVQRRSELAWGGCPGCSLAPVQSSMTISVYAETLIARMPGKSEASSKTTKGVRSTVTWQHTHS
jgi:hypothetical protein